MIVLKEKDYGKFSELLGKARKGIKNIGTKFGKKAEGKPVMTINGSKPSSLTYNLPGSSKSVVSSVQPTRSSVITPASQSKQVNVVSSSAAKKSPKKQYDPSRKKKRGYARKQRQAQKQDQQAANNPASESVMTNNPGAVTSPNPVTVNPPAKGMTRFQRESLARQGQPRPQTSGKLTVLGDKGPAINPNALNESGSVIANQPAKGMTRFQKETLARQGQPKPQIPQGKLMILGDKGPAINPNVLNGTSSVMTNPGVVANQPTRGMTRYQKETLARQGQPRPQTPQGKLTILGDKGPAINPNALGNGSSVVVTQPTKGMTRFQKETLARQGQPKPQTPQGKLTILGEKGPAINPRDLENGSGSVLKNNGTIQFNKTDVPEGSVMPTAHRGGIREQQRLRQEAMARMNANPQKYQGLQYHTEAGGYQYVPNSGLQNRGVVPKKPQTIVFTPEQGNVTAEYGKGSVMSNPKPEQPKAPKSSPKQTQTPKGKGKGTQTTQQTTKGNNQQTNTTQQTSNQQGNQETPGYWQRGKEWWGRRSGLEKAGIIGGATAVPFAGYNIYRNSNND